MPQTFLPRIIPASYGVVLRRSDDFALTYSLQGTAQAGASVTICEPDATGVCELSYAGDLQDESIQRALSALIAAATQYMVVSGFSLRVASGDEPVVTLARSLGMVADDKGSYRRLLPDAAVRTTIDEHTVDVLTLPDLRPSGVTQTIVEAIRANAWMPTVDVWLYRDAPEPQLLFQQRDPASPTFAGLLDCSVAGYLMAGESGAVGGARELAEELGVDVSPNELEPYSRRLNAMLDHRGRERRIVADIFLYCWQHELADLTPHHEEVYAVYWIGAQQLRAIASGQAVPVSGRRADGETIHRQLTKVDFAYNIDDYYFALAERIAHKSENNSARRNG